VRGRPVLALALAISCGGLFACSSPDEPGGRPPAPKASPAELDSNHPFNAESNMVIASVASHSEVTLRNRGVASFDSKEVVSFHRNEQAVDRQAQAANVRAARTETTGQSLANTSTVERHDQELAAREASQKAETKVVERGSEETHVGQDATGKGVRQETVAGAGAKQETVTGTGARQETSSRSEGTQTSEQKIEVGREETFTATNVTTRAIEQSTLSALAKRDEAYLRVKSSTMAEMILFDRVLGTYFRSTKEEFYKRILAETVSQNDVTLRTRKSTPVVTPGETFSYQMELRVNAGQPISNIFLYDVFPPELLYENQKSDYRVELAVGDGPRRPAKPEELPLNYLITPNQLEQGKIGWHFPLTFKLAKGERLFLTFDATWYFPDAGRITRDGARVLRSPAAGAEVVDTLRKDDLALVAFVAAEDRRYFRISGRRAGSGARVEGFLDKDDWEVFKKDTQAIDEEQKLKRDTIYHDLKTDVPEDGK
jgi:hypothetical protein